MPPAPLHERLRRLRGDSGAAAPAITPTGASLGERLRRLDPGGLRVGVAAAPARPPDTDAVLAEALGAALIAPGLLCCERTWPLQRPHGRWRPTDASGTVADLLPTATLTGDTAGWLFLDTETSGLAGGTGTWAFVCGLGQITDEHLRLRQYLLTGLDAESLLMAQVGAALAAATLWISFNGKTFDLPLLATRLRLTGQPAPPATRPHLDLLHPLRRAFAGRWPDCRLSSAEQRLLGFTRTDDLPGAEAPAAWRDWLQRGDGGRLGAVLAHNRWDLLSLAALIPALSAVQRDPAAHDADAVAIARHLQRQGRAGAARQALGRPEGNDARALLALAQLHRQAGDWPAALALWGPLAARAQPAALLALAKYHEHVSHDRAAALALAQRLPAGADRERRCQRLRGALTGAAAGGPSSAGLPVPTQGPLAAPDPATAARADTDCLVPHEAGV